MARCRLGLSGGGYPMKSVKVNRNQDVGMSTTELSAQFV